MSQMSFHLWSVKIESGAHMIALRCYYYNDDEMANVKKKKNNRDVHNINSIDYYNVCMCVVYGYLRCLCWLCHFELILCLFVFAERWRLYLSDPHYFANTEKKKSADYGGRSWSFDVAVYGELL